MTFEWVKCRRGPRISQMPSSGWSHTWSRWSMTASDHVAGQCRGGRRAPSGRADTPLDTAGPRRVQHLAEHVELELLAGLVADAHRLRALVAGQPVELDLGEAALAADAVHDLEVARRAGHRAAQPLVPRLGLLVVAAAEQGLQRERRVAQPGVAVVPVAHAADLLGQRGGGRRDDRAGRRVGEGLERDERAHDVVAPLALVGAARHPRPATTRSVRRSAASASSGSGGSLERREPRQREAAAARPR